MPKHYDIWVKPTIEDPDYPPYGVEIQPPLGELAAQGLCHVLARRPIPEESNLRHHADSAYVTRNDEVGTALVVYPPARFLDAETLAVFIQGYIDPHDQLEVELHYPPSVLDQ